jgi:hypothetical protein
MQEQIGEAAGAIWRALGDKGELSLAQLKKETRGRSPVFDWGVGWLAREDKLEITPDKRSFRLRLK